MRVGRARHARLQATGAPLYYTITSPCYVNNLNRRTIPILYNDFKYVIREFDQLSGRYSALQTGHPNKNLAHFNPVPTCQPDSNRNRSRPNLSRTKLTLRV